MLNPKYTFLNPNAARLTSSPGNKLWSKSGTDRWEDLREYVLLVDASWPMRPIGGRNEKGMAHAWRDQEFTFRVRTWLEDDR